MLTAGRSVVDWATMDKRLPTPTNYRWNFICFTIDSVFFGIGMTLININSVLPAFVSQFTRSAPVIGLVSTVFHGCWFLPQVVAARAINDKPRKKPYLLAGLSGRVAFVILPLALWLGLGQYPVGMLVLFFVCLGIFAIPDSLAAVAWSDMVARAIPLRRRGRLFSLAQSISGVAGLGVGAAIGLILASPRLPFPTDYALIFSLAGVSLVPATVALFLLREDAADLPTIETQGRVRDPWLTALRHDPAFLRVMASRILVGMIMLAMPFYVIHATEVLNLPMAAVGGFVAAQQLAVIGFGPLLGMVSDRWGPSAVIRIGSLACIAGPLFALVAHLSGEGPLVRAYPLVYVALGAYQSVSMLGHYNYLLEIAPSHLRPSYIGLANTLMGVLTLAPIAGGWLLQATSYTVLFGITAGLVAVGALVSLGLRPANDPTAPEELSPNRTDPCRSGTIRASQRVTESVRSAGKALLSCRREPSTSRPCNR